ncbi:20164_t:CDS:2 [Entrophospora sp. SA101]|nr:20164_t:CDS:2 [Entrophospora sp. SA101]
MGEIESYKNGYGDAGKPIFPYDLISKHFNRETLYETINIIVRLDTQPPY